MNKRTSKRQRDLKTKLMAAVCMLLVSSIMMVSTTYAWFTLSTAPEVTGITTAVGANGNLEMALQPYNGDLNAITSGEQDSLKLPLERNVTWGNLVDVSDNASYGMNLISLYPAELNATGNQLDAKPLKTPVYGADGRVSGVNANTITGAFDPINLQFAESMSYNGATLTNAKGVRAVGTSSSLSAREMASRNALSSAISEKSGAKKDAGTTLNNNGTAIGKIAMKHATNDGAGYTQAEIQPLKDAVNDMIKVADRIEASLKNYLLAESLAPAAADAYYADLVTNINAAATLAEAEQVAHAIVPTDSEYATAKAELAQLRADLQTAAGINELTGDAIPWRDLSAKLQVLVDMNMIKVNDMTMAQIESDGTAEGYVDADGKPIDGKQQLINTVTDAGMKVTIAMPNGSGIFSDIASFVGTYTAAFDMQVSYSGFSAKVGVTMNASGVTPAYLDSIDTTDFVAGDGGSSGNPIGTYYGYIIDLAFRTNAADSYLQLQTDAIDRIYDGTGSNPDTMGHGASMTFQTDSTSFGENGVRSLMSNIRLVFFKTTAEEAAGNEIIAYGKLNTEKASVDGVAITMPIMLTTDHTFATAKTDEASTDVDESIQIMALGQNEPTALSVMVYLDGKNITNADVAADVAKSMYGNMNLQFSSSANLQPMEYADLMAEGASDVVSYSAMNNYTVPKGYTVRAYTDNVDKIAFTLNGTVLEDSKAVTIKIDGTEYPTTKAAMAGMEGYVVDLPEGVSVSSSTAFDIFIDGVGANTPTNYNVTLTADSGITSSGAATANNAADYSFELTATGYTVTKVEYTIGNTTKVLTAAEGVYTIPKAEIIGNITITVTATADAAGG